MEFKKFIICLLLVLVLLAPTVFAVDEVLTAEALASAATINKDFYITNTDSYTLSDVVNGTVFASVTSKFVTNPRVNGGIINGNLFLFANEAVIGSDVTYSNDIDENGTYAISSVNSSSKINGNVFAFAPSFTLEAGSEIAGDLYLLTTEFNVEPGAIIHGNLYVKSSSINFAGKVEKSAYIFSDNFNMKPTGEIGTDLFVNADNSTISGSVNRDSHITVVDALKVNSNFSNLNDLYISYADTLELTGNITGSAYIKAKNITLNNDENNKLLINGNLTYSTKTKIDIPEGVVLGEISSSEFTDNTASSFNFGYWIISILAFLAYVFGIIFIFKKFVPKALESLPELNTGNVLKSLLIGTISLFAFILILFVLLLSNIGLVLGLLLLLAYLLVFGLSIPLFINKVANKINIKSNSNLKLLIVALVLFFVRRIPLVGSLLVWLIVFTGIGDILVTIFKKK